MADCERLLSDLRSVDTDTDNRRAEGQDRAATVAAQARISLKELTAQIAGIRVRLETSQAAAEGLDSDRVARTVAAATARELGWPSSAVFIQTGQKTQQFALVATHNWPSAAAFQAPRVADLVNRCAEKKSVQITDDLLPGQTLVATPVLEHDSAVAAICVVAAGREEASDDRCIATLRSITTSVSEPLLETLRYEEAERECWCSAQELIQALEARSRYRRNHAHHVAEYAGTIGEALSLGEREIADLKHAGLLHDIGEIAVAPSVFDKPAELSKNELDMLHAHPVKGEEIARDIKAFERLRDAIRHHHEHWDGNGYPDHLTQDKIPFQARIINLADAFDALTSDRSYREAQSTDFALSEIEKQAGTQFDPELAKLCAEAFRRLQQKKGQN